MNPMYRAELSRGELIIIEVAPGVIRRTGHQGLSATKFEACEQLKKDIMQEFRNDMRCVDWQSQQYIRDLKLTDANSEY